MHDHKTFHCAIDVLLKDSNAYGNTYFGATSNGKAFAGKNGFTIALHPTRCSRWALS